MLIYVKKRRVDSLDAKMKLVETDEFYCHCIEEETIHNVRRTPKGTLFIQCTECGEVSLGALEEVCA